MSKIDDLISTIKQISNAVHIPANDSRHLMPNLGTLSQNNSINKQTHISHSGNSESIIGPMIDSTDEAWSSIKHSSDFRPEWGAEDKLGTESLAWYVSFHRSNYWGIYIPYSGLLRFASNFLDICKDPNVAIELAWNSLISHEAIHYGIDVACAHLEVISRSPIYLNGQAGMRLPKGHIPEEEQLAEAAMLRYIKSYKPKNYFLNNDQVKQIYFRAVQRSEKLPVGYRDGVKCISPKNFSKHLSQYLNNLCRTSLPSHFSLANDCLNLNGLLPALSNGYINPSVVNYSDCPIHVFDDTPINSRTSDVIHFITQIPHIEESPEFMAEVSPYFKQWIKTKELLGNPSYPKNKDNLDFKRWEDEDCPQKNTRAWSVRVGKKTNMRAHIDEYISSKRWVARKFGDANKMGHHKNRK